MRKEPRDCRDMRELRVEIDELDRRLVALLARRAAFIDRAAEIKRGVGLAARIPVRIEDVVAKVRAASDAAGLDPDLAEGLWREIIEWSVAREEATLGRPPQD